MCLGASDWLSATIRLLLLFIIIPRLFVKFVSFCCVLRFFFEIHIIVFRRHRKCEKQSFWWPLIALFACNMWTNLYAISHLATFTRACKRIAHSITLSGSIHTITGRRAYDAHGASHTKFTGRSICESYNMCHRASAAARSPETMLCNWLLEQWNTRLQSFRNNMKKLISDFSRSPVQIG